MKSKNKQILKVTALYVIWNPKSVKCPASISENPVPLFDDSQIFKVIFQRPKGEQDSQIWMPDI